jgi:hypothetical protein
MKYLAYCILPDWDGLRAVLLRSPETVSLEFVVEEGLACVFARVSDRVQTPAVSELLEYAHVIEALAQHCCLLPMRYGSVLDREDQVRDLLHSRRTAFRSRLEQLEGCCEMTIRVLSEGDSERKTAVPGNQPQPQNGAAYLASRRANYQANEQQNQQISCLCDQIRRHFLGLFRNANEERSTVKGRSLVSLYFLVSKEHLDAFLTAFHQFQKTSSNKVLLSGPWPPYHFAGCE